MNRHIFAVFLALIVILAGCTSTTSVGKVGGISINKFMPDYSEIRSGDQVRLTLSIQNIGGYAATDLVAQIFSGVSKNLGWDFTSGADTQTLIPDELAPIDETNNFPGESLDYTWTLGSPSNLAATTPYTAGVRVYYHYGTSSLATLRFYSDNYLKSLPEAQYQSLSRSAGLLSQKSSPGPLSVSFSTGARPLIVKGGTGETFELQISFENRGGGNMIDPDAALPSSDYGYLNKASYTLTTNGLTLTCPKEGGGDMSGTEISGKMTLSAGRSKVIYCTIESPSSEVVNSQDYTVGVQVIYGYYVEGQTTINVLAAPSGSGGGGSGSSGGTGGTISLSDVCSKSCGVTNQIYTTGKPAVGICADRSLSTAKYPGTAVDVTVSPLDASVAGKLNTVFGSDYSKATIRSLNLHDAKAGDLNIQSMTIGMLDTKTTSSQYENARLSPKTSGTIGIVDYLCGDNIPYTVVLTLDNKDKGTLCKGYPSSTPLSGTLLSNMKSVNAQSGNDFKDSQLSGLAITSIAGRSVSDITGSLSSINVEDFKIASISTVLSSVPADKNGQYYTQYVKCGSSNVVSSYGPDTVCQCVIGIGEKYGAYDGTANSACNSVCTKVVDGKRWADAGVCNAHSVRGTSQCKGTTLVTYHSGSIGTDPANACGSNECLCYDTRGMSSAEATLVCK